MGWQSYRQKLRLWESKYGRDSGWFIELDGEPIALLTDCRWEEMFWDSYRLVILTPDAELAERMATRDFWNTAVASERLVYWNREFAACAPYALPGGFPAPGRVMMRGRYVATGEPGLIDRLFLCWRKKTARGRM